jgi:integrase
MDYLNKTQLRELFTIAYNHNKLHHLSLITSFYHGLRTSEVCGSKGIRGHQIFNGKLTVQRLKRSEKTTQPLHLCPEDVILDETPLIALAVSKPNDLLFNWSRQNADNFIKRYAIEAGLQLKNPPKGAKQIGCHQLKHACAMLLFEKTKNLGVVKSHLGHKSPGSTMCYLVAYDEKQASEALEGVSI